MQSTVLQLLRREGFELGSAYVTQAEEKPKLSLGRYWTRADIENYVGRKEASSNKRTVISGIPEDFAAVCELDNPNKLKQLVEAECKDD
jgi:hypothetical protein